MDTVLRIHPIEPLERQRDHNFTRLGYQSDNETPAAIVAGAVVRFKVWDVTDVDLAPMLDVDSVALPSATFTADAATDTITSTAHGLTDGQRVKLSSTGTIPAGLSTSTVYYVRDSAPNTFKVSLTSAGSAVDITSAGSGTHTWTRVFSTITINSLGVEGSTPFSVTVALHRDEINLLTAGEWNWEASIVMPAQNNRCFVFSRGTFDSVTNTAGDLGTT